MPDTTKFRIAEMSFKTYYDYELLSVRCHMDNLDSADPLVHMDAMREMHYQQECFLREQDTLLEPICLANLSNDDAEYPCIYANHRAVPYLQETIPSLSTWEVGSTEFCILIPSFLTNGEQTQLLDESLDTIMMIEGKDVSRAECTVIYYDNYTDVLYFESGSNNGIAFHSNPYICITATPYAELPAPIDSSRRSMLLAGMVYRSGNMMVNDILAPYQLSASNTDLMALIDEKVEVCTAMLRLVLAFVTIMIIFHSIVIFSVIRLEYQVNAMELAVKKILGYGILQKNRNTLRLSVGSMVFGTVISAVLFLMMGAFSFAHLCITTGVLLVIEWGLIFVAITIIERRRLVKILKGGAL